ncbi:MAG: hypothetical protein ACTSV7_13470 [Candidatus Baldrarchaeia archaeon]
MAEETYAVVRYREKEYPIEAWRLVYRYVTARRAPDAYFDRTMRRLGVSLDDAYRLYRAQLYTPWEIRFITKYKIPPEEEFVADEECTGNDIYYNMETDKYSVRDPDTNKLIRTENKICMEFTASISTFEGHDVPLIVEITATTYCDEMGLSELTEAEKKVEEGLRNWLIEQNWGNVIDAFIKEGIAYNGEQHVEARVRYPWDVPDYPAVHVKVEKKEPRKRDYEGEFEIEE